MVSMPSLNLRQCATRCKEKFDWKLDKGQKSLLGNSRDKGLQS
jgi:hypothetical protein